MHRGVAALAGAGRVVQGHPDPARPLADRPGWQLAMRVVREGYADGVMVPRYEQVSSDLAAYEEVLDQLHEGGWFLGLALPERGW